MISASTALEKRAQQFQKLCKRSKESAQRMTSATKGGRKTERETKSAIRKLRLEGVVHGAKLRNWMWGRRCGGGGGRGIQARGCSGDSVDLKNGGAGRRERWVEMIERDSFQRARDVLQQAGRALSLSLAAATGCCISQLASIQEQRFGQGDQLQGPKLCITHSTGEEPCNNNGETRGTPVPSISEPKYVELEHVPRKLA